MGLRLYATRSRGESAAYLACMKLIEADPLAIGVKRREEKRRSYLEKISETPWQENLGLCKKKMGAGREEELSKT